MRYIDIIIILIICLALLLFTGCRINEDKAEIPSGNLENQEEINQSSNNSQSSSTVPIYDPETVYPQQWATGTGTIGDPWAGDCVNDAYTACPAAGTIYLRAGYYTLSTQLNVIKAINIIGEGIGKTFIVTGMTTTNGIYVAADYVTLKGFTLDGDSQVGGTAYQRLLGIGYYDYNVVEDIEVMNGGYYGMNIVAVNHSTFKNIYAHDNYRHGLHSGSDDAGRNMYNTYQDIYAWNNGSLGFADRGNGEVDCQ